MSMLNEYMIAGTRDVYVMCRSRLFQMKGTLLMGYLPTNGDPPNPTASQYYDGSQLVRKAGTQVSVCSLAIIIVALSFLLPLQYELAIAEGEISHPAEVFSRKYGHSLFACHWLSADYW